MTPFVPTLFSSELHAGARCNLQPGQVVVRKETIVMAVFI